MCIRDSYISLYEDLRIRDTAIHMTLRREGDDIIEIILGKQVFHQYFVTDISLYEDCLLYTSTLICD